MKRITFLLTLLLSLLFQIGSVNAASLIADDGNKISVTTKSPTSVTSTSAVLNASMTTKGYPSFFIKETNSSSTATMYSLFESLSSPANPAWDFRYTLTWLKCGTSYTYYAQASHEFSYMWSAQGSSISFTTTKCETAPPPVACTKEYAPVCGQPPMPKCSAWMACAQAMPSPKTYTNNCMMQAENATYLYNGACKTTTPITVTGSVKTTTLPATSITWTSAVMNAQISIQGNYSGLELYHRFVRKMTAYPNIEPIYVALPKKNIAGQFNYTATGLLCDTEYSYYVETLYRISKEDYIVTDMIKNEPMTFRTASCSNNPKQTAPVSCTKEIRRCGNGTIMPRDEKTCEWKENMCATSSVQNTSTNDELYAFAKQWNLIDIGSSKSFLPETQLTRREAGVILRQWAKIFNSWNKLPQLHTRELTRYFSSNAKITRYETRKILDYIFSRSWNTILVGSIEDWNPKDIITRWTLIRWIHDAYVKIKK